MLTLMGIGTMAFTGLGNYLQYMNRDIKTWIYVVEGIIGLLMTLAFILGGLCLNIK